MTGFRLFAFAYVAAVSGLGMAASTTNSDGLYLAVLVALLPVGVVEPIALFVVASALSLLFGDSSGPEWLSALPSAVAFSCAAVANVATVHALTRSANRCRHRHQQVSF